MELLLKIALLSAVCTLVTHAVPIPDSWVERGQLKIAGEPDMRVNYELLDSNFQDDKVTLIYRVSMVGGSDDKSGPEASRHQDTNANTLVKRASDDREVELSLRADQFLESNSNRYSRAVSQSEAEEPLEQLILMGNGFDNLWRNAEND